MKGSWITLMPVPTFDRNDQGGGAMVWPFIATVQSVPEDQGSTVHYVFMLLDDLKQDLKLNEETGGRFQPAIGELVNLSTLPVWPIWLGCLRNRAAWFSKEIHPWIKCLSKDVLEKFHFPMKAFSMCSVHLCTVRLTVVVLNIDIIANGY